MMNVMNDVNETKPQETDALKRVVELAKQLVEVTERVEGLEESLQKAKTLQRQIETEHLPELMRELELTSMSLADGMRLELKDEFDCGITVANHKAALRWLDDNKFGSIIKTKVQVAFSRDDRAAALALSASATKFIKARRVDTSCEMLETVHPQTLKSFLKEEMSKGTNIPHNLFSIHPYSKAKLTQKQSR